MSIFSAFGEWLSGFFKKARPGLTSFLHKHEGEATAIVARLAGEFAGTPMNQWRDKAFAEVKGAVDQAGQHPDTWISLLVDFGHEIVKAQEVKAA